MFLPRTVDRDVYTQNKAASVIGYITTAMMVAPMFAPAMGGWITDTYSWRYMYLGLAGLSLVLFFMSYRYQYETLAVRQTALGVCLTLLVGYLLPLNVLWLYLVITASMMLSISGLWFTLLIHRKGVVAETVLA